VIKLFGRPVFKPEPAEVPKYTSNEKDIERGSLKTDPQSITRLFELQSSAHRKWLYTIQINWNANDCS